MANEGTQKDLWELSDEEFLASAGNGPEAEEPAPEGAQSATGEAEEGQGEVDETGGADSSSSPSEEEPSGADSTSEQEPTGQGTSDPNSQGTGPRTDPHQGDEPVQEPQEKDKPKPAEPETDSELAEVLAPLKAAKRTIEIGNVENARRLMSMGVDYSRKMEQIKPYMRAMKTLERADLLAEDKLNFLIDLADKKPEAIKKLLKDSDIDPLELDLEENADYQPTAHMIGDKELAIEEAMDAIRGSEAFDQTIDVVRAWDEVSKAALLDDPRVLGVINSHIEAGLYQQVMDRVASERIFGKYAGLSDLEVYRAVGDAMHAEGAFGAPNQPAPSSSGNADQGPSQDLNGSQGREARKRAASPPKGNASPKVPPPNFLGMSDEEFEKYRQKPGGI